MNHPKIIQILLYYFDNLPVDYNDSESDDYMVIDFTQFRIRNFSDMLSSETPPPIVRKFIEDNTTDGFLNKDIKSWYSKFEDLANADGNMIFDHMLDQIVFEDAQDSKDPKYLEGSCYIVHLKHGVVIFLDDDQYIYLQCDTHSYLDFKFDTSDLTDVENDLVFTALCCDDIAEIYKKFTINVSKVFYKLNESFIEQFSQIALEYVMNELLYK